MLQNLRFFISFNDFSCSAVLSTRASESRVCFSSFKRLFSSVSFCFLVLTRALFLIAGCLAGALPSNSLPLPSTKYEIKGNEEKNEHYIDLLKNYTIMNMYAVFSRLSPFSRISSRSHSLALFSHYRKTRKIKTETSRSVAIEM